MRGWILLGLFLPALLGAQPSVTVNAVPDSLAGVALIGTGDAAYIPAVQSLIAPDRYPAYQPMLPYSVLVRNDTGRAIADVCVVFEITQASGENAGSISKCPGNIPPSGLGPLLAPGGAILISAVFADGTMAGPDKQSSFLRYSADLAADRDFASTVKALDSAPISVLEGYLHQLDSASRARGGDWRRRRRVPTASLSRANYRTPIWFLTCNSPVRAGR